MTAAAERPTVQIVGAGPGATDLLTLRAARAIEAAEVLVWTDSLINPQIAALATESCQKIRTSTLTLEEVLAVVVEKARAGLRVVRLHDGDPCLYGALAEQICRLADADIAVEVVPGLSAYQATASALGQELTIPVWSRPSCSAGPAAAPGYRSANRCNAWPHWEPRSASISAPATWRRCSKSCCSTIPPKPL